MSYVIKAVLSNPQCPECGQVTIPFPIPVDQYDQTIDMLQAMELGRPVNRDCKVDEIDSHYSVLGALKGMLVNVDQMDYLAKRLDSFCVGEDSQFQAMAHKLEMTDITDFINLTFYCQQATVITDFSNLEAVGRSHFLNRNTCISPLQNGRSSGRSFGLGSPHCMMLRCGLTSMSCRKRRRRPWIWSI